MDFNIEKGPSGVAFIVNGRSIWVYMYPYLKQTSGYEPGKFYHWVETETEGFLDWKHTAVNGKCRTCGEKLPAFIELALKLES